MYASYHHVRAPRRLPHGNARTISAAMSRALRGSVLWTIVASLLVCAALGWLTYEICNRTDIATIALPTDMPRNVIDMHNFYG